MSEDRKPGKKTLTGVAGAGAAILLLAYVPQFEGVILRGYKDPIGIVTACAGHTRTAVLGRAYSREECERLLDEDLVEHAEVVERCITAPLTHYQRAALISFAYNVGPGKRGVKDGLCVLRDGREPTIRRRFNAGDYEGGCAALSEWITAGGIVMGGLVKRRAIERAMCEGAIQ